MSAATFSISPPGVVLAAVALELLPELPRTSALAAVVAGFAGGTGLMLLIRWLTLRGADVAEQEHESRARMLMIIGLDILIDGFLIGIGFAAEAGRLLTFALTIELLFLGLSAAVQLQQSAVDRRWLIAATSCLALLVEAHEVPETLGSSAMFFVGFLLFLVIEMLGRARS